MTRLDIARDLARGTSLRATNPDDRTASLWRAAEALCELFPNDWPVIQIAVGLSYWADRGSACDLAKMLGVTGPARASKEQRNDLVKSAVMCMLHGGLIGPSDSASKALHAALTRFFAGTYHRWRDDARIPAEGTHLEVLLFRIIKLNGGAVMTDRTLRSILKAEGANAPGSRNRVEVSRAPADHAKHGHQHDAITASTPGAGVAGHRTAERLGT